MTLFHRFVGFILAATLAFAPVPASAVTPAQAVVVLGGAPGWVLPGRPTAQVDWQNNRAWLNGRAYTGQASIIGLFSTFSTPAHYATGTNGLLYSVPANSLDCFTVPVAYCQGQLPEAAATNLIVQSNGFTTGWTTQSTTAAAAAGTAPDGSATVWSLTPFSNSLNHSIFRIASAATTTVTNAVYAKAGAASWLGLGFDANAQTDGAYFNLATGAVGTVASGATARIVALGNGWYRCSVTRTYSSASHYLTIEPHTADNQPINWSASGTESILIWGAQQEAGSSTSSYTPTTTASVTRAASNISATGNALATAAQNAKAAYVKSIGLANSTGRLFTFNGGAYARASSTTQIAVSNGTNTATATIGASGTISGTVKSAFGFDASSLTAVANAGTPATQASAWSGNTGALYIGSDAAGANNANGYIAGFAFGNSKGQFNNSTALP